MMHKDAHQIPTTVIRRATREDAAHTYQVLVRSVREICAKDYGHDQALLAWWCANKTVETVTEWILHPAHYFLVAEVPPHGIVGVGLLDMPTGEIVLCYIVPEVLHQGGRSASLPPWNSRPGPWDMRTSAWRIRLRLATSICGMSIILMAPRPIRIRSPRSQ